MLISTSYIFNIAQRRSLSTATRSLYDVAIVGGGPVGNAMACALGQSNAFKNRRIVVLEASKPGRLGAPPAKYTNKVFACAPASIKMFKRLGIWDTLVDYRVKRVEGLFVLDACSQSSVRFDPVLGENSVSYLIEDTAISKALYGRILDTCPNVEIRDSTRVEECRLPKNIGDVAQIKLQDGTELNALLVVGADGARSYVRRAMGVESTGWSYNQKAIVATLSVETYGGSNAIAWQRFTPLGPIALLPLTDGLSSLVWTTTNEDAERLMLMPDDRFVDELNHYLFTNAAQNESANRALDVVDRFARYLRFTTPLPTPTSNARLPTVLEVRDESRAAFPLAFNHARTYVAPRTALIGDSAHRIHPLAGQGVNLGWTDVRLLVKTLEAATREGADVGSLTYLSQYDSASQRHNMPVMVAVDWLNRLYRTSSPTAVFLRSLGLHAVDKLTPIKDLIVSRASH